VIGEMGGSLGHGATAAGWAHPAPLARERDDKPLAAAGAPGAGESEAEDSAIEIAAEFFLDVARHGPLGTFPPGEPALEVLRHDLVARRLLGATALKSGERDDEPTVCHRIARRQVWLVVTVCRI